MKVGILGAGGIAAKMAKTLSLMDSAKAEAVSSRDYNKAKAFADANGVSKAYGSYEEMLNDPEVSLVYVATPHSHHYEHMKLCLEHGKHVLCEKAFTVNAAQAKEVIELGEKKKLLVAEAIWTRYLPMRKVMDKILAEGLAGAPHSLTANLGHPLPYMERLTNPDLAGGAWLDMGVYTVNFALMTFGSNIERIESSRVPYKTGVDAASSTTLIYKDGRMAMLHSSILAKGDSRGMVFCEKGYIEFLDINNCAGIRVYNTDNKLLASYDPPKQLTGFEYQVEACRKAIEEGKVECPEMPHSEILKVMEIMDSVRNIWGFRYPGEK
jgi:predicted dehydrogenase